MRKSPNVGVRDADRPFLDSEKTAGCQYGETGSSRRGLRTGLEGWSLAPLRCPRPPPDVFWPQETGKGARTSTYALGRAPLPRPAKPRARQRREGRVATFPVARTPGPPNLQHFLPALIHCHSPFKPAPLPRPLQPGPGCHNNELECSDRYKACSARRALSPPAGPRVLPRRGWPARRKRGTHNERDGAVLTELLRSPTGPRRAPAAGGCCVGSVVLP